MVTAFSVFAALEQGGRKRGGKGLLGWIWKLPWDDPSVSAQLLAGLAFMLGGASGLINASYTVNLVVHNTSFIVGHFHLTVGTRRGPVDHGHRLLAGAVPHRQAALLARPGRGPGLDRGSSAC